MQFGDGQNLRRERKRELRGDTRICQLSIEQIIMTFIKIEKHSMGVKCWRKEAEKFIGLVIVRLDTQTEKAIRYLDRVLNRVPIRRQM